MRHRRLPAQAPGNRVAANGRRASAATGAMLADEVDCPESVIDLNKRHLPALKKWGESGRPGSSDIILPEAPQGG
jgi:hypothetical protein